MVSISDDHILFIGQSAEKFIDFIIFLTAGYTNHLQVLMRILS